MCDVIGTISNVKVIPILGSFFWVGSIAYLLLCGVIENQIRDWYGISVQLIPFYERKPLLKFLN